MKFLILDEQLLRISLTVSSRLRNLEISWYNLQLPAQHGTILVTSEEPQLDGQFKEIEQSTQAIRNDDEKYYVKSGAVSEVVSVAGSGDFTIDELDEDKTVIRPSRLLSSKIWTYNDKPIRYWLRPTERTGWHTTTVLFDYTLFQNITKETKCYGFWATYVAESGAILAKTCIRAYPTWMNDMRSHIGKFKFNDLFLVGTHDSGSFKEGFNPKSNETLVTKYSITQVSE